MRVECLSDRMSSDFRFASREGPAPSGSVLEPTRPVSFKTCYLVDPASSHMLVSKIKPCMCKYEQIQTVKLRMAH